MRNGLGRAKNRERLTAFFAIGETDFELIRYTCFAAIKISYLYS